MIIDPMDTEYPESLSVLGIFGSPYGILGWIKIYSFTEKFENIFYYQPWCVIKEGKYQDLNVENKKYLNNKWIIKINGIDNREKVQQFTNCTIIINTSQFPVLKNGEYYWKDLIGCHIMNINGEDLGWVVNLIDTISHDILIAHRNSKNTMQEQLIPFIEGQVIKKVDLRLQMITVDWENTF